MAIARSMSPSSSSARGHDHFALDGANLSAFALGAAQVGAAAGIQM